MCVCVCVCVCVLLLLFVCLFACFFLCFVLFLSFQIYQVCQVAVSIARLPAVQSSTLLLSSMNAVTASKNVIQYP